MLFRRFRWGGRSWRKYVYFSGEGDTFQSSRYTNRNLPISNDTVNDRFKMVWTIITPGLQGRMWTWRWGISQTSKKPISREITRYRVLCPEIKETIENSISPKWMYIGLCLHIYYFSLLSSCLFISWTHLSNLVVISNHYWYVF